VVKLIFCLKRLPQLSREEFQAYWRETHAPLVRRHAQVLGIARYVQSHSFPLDPNSPLAHARGSAGQDYDGVAELWWQDMASLAAAGETAEGRAAGQLLLEDEARFIDLPRSPLFLVEEEQFVG
jgi:uncharacterized protein (TIGR02118 family)